MTQDLERRLLAIMFTDMVGFTALMQKDETLGLQKRKRHRQVFEEEHAKFNGEIIQYFGDGTLSVFSNSVHAVACAIKIQKALKTPIEVPLRIGIHTGNVVIEKDGIVGDAVNIASRIESFANVGGVLISDAIHDQIKNQVQWDFVHLGKFSLKNVDRPFEIYAIATEDLVVPDPDFLHGKGQRYAALKGDIPIPATPILGREKEVKDVIELLRKHQVVTLSGTGGMGKTRLSLEICHFLKPTFKDGIAFISMATLTDAKEVMPTLAAALDVKEAEGRELVKGVAALISERKALIVLDNLEQVISAAQEIAELISMCPNLKILCTSRTPLKIKAEQEYPLHPLPLPAKADMDSLMENPAIELFVERAERVNIDFELTDDNAEAVLEICRRMDGLPLALELAAARIRILPPEKLLQRLNRALDLLTGGSKDLPERHQTLRATIAWSHSLLNESEQQLFRRLAAFAGGFTLEAIEAVCYADADAAFLAMDELESLLDKGLVENVDGGSRFSLLQTIKDFAAERLIAVGEADATFQKHAQFFSKIAQVLSEGTMGEHQIERMRQGALEDANIHVAIDFLLEKAKGGDENAKELGLNVCGELFMYWHIRGKHKTAKEYINSFFDATKDQTPSIGKCKALFNLQVATFTLGEMDQSKAAAMENHAMAEILKDKLEMVKSSFSMSFGHLFLDFEVALQYSHEAVARCRELDNDYWLGFTLWQHGLVQMINGDLETAKESLSESLSLFQKTKDNEGKGCAQSGLAMLEFIACDYENAIESYQDALSAFEAVGDRPEEARVLSEMSWTYLAHKNTVGARKCIMDSIQAYQEVGSTRGIGLSLNGLAAIEAVEGHPKLAVEIAAAAEHFAEQEGVVVEFGANNHGKIYLDNAKKELSEMEIDNAIKTGITRTIKEIIEMTELEAVRIS
jgi:predicted ATPase/class 3 adenylate cyclase